MEVIAAIELITKLLGQAQTISAMLKAHQQDGTPIDLDALAAADDAARKALADANAAAHLADPPK